MTPFVVDANVMNCYQAERIRGVPAEAHAAIDAITATSCIALDSDGHCQGEWIECAGGRPPLALLDWIADMLVAEKIQLFQLQQGSMHQKLSALGIPKKDHKWVRLACSVPSDVIVTEDIDLFDPKKKKSCTANKKAQIKSQRKGPVAKYLKKTHAIDVICIQHVLDFIQGVA